MSGIGLYLLIVLALAVVVLTVRSLGGEAPWRVAVLVIFVAAMLLTPTTDPYSMLLLAGPLTVLYFGGVLLCRVMPRLRPRAIDYVG